MEASYKPTYSASDAGRKVGLQMSGYIFMCSAKTKPDCFAYRVFGLPASRIEIVEKIKSNTALFLFDFDLRLLYGQYVADSSGKLAIEPLAFGGLFPAQVKFSIVRDCLPLREVAFKDAIKENYYSSSKFKQELSSEQVSKLVALFRPIHIPLTLQTTMYDNARERFPSWYRGSSVQTAEPPSYGHVNGSGLAHAQLHRSISLVQEAPLRPFLDHNRVVSLRNDTLAPQFDPVSPHQAYHPDDPGLLQHDTHARNAHMHSNGSGAIIPQITTASYYGVAPTPLSNAIHAQSKAVTPSPPATSSSLTASQWVAIAAGSQSLGGQTTAVIIPSSSELGAPYSTNVATVAHQYPNQGYHHPYQEQSVISDPGHSFPPQTLVSSNSGVGVTVDQTYMHDSTNSTTLASGYQYQGYSDPSYYQTQATSQTAASASGYQYQGHIEPSYYQAVSQTTDQHVSYVPGHVPGTHSAYWANAPGHMIEQYQITQATVPGVNDHPVSSYTNVPVYSAEANATY